MKKADAIKSRIFRTLKKMSDLRMAVIRDVMALDRHHGNRIAAHKAHTTMAKNRAR